MNKSMGAVALLGIYATFALDCYSTFCSSPQTTELNAKTRAPTLMKWVGIGGGVAIMGGGAASIYAKKNGEQAWWAPFIGSFIITVILYVLYVHAKNSGLNSNEPGTESYRSGY